MPAEKPNRSTSQSHPWIQAGFDLVTLRIVHAAALEQTFAKAARRENTSLSAVSRRVSEFEDRIGIPLFDRHDRGVVLTQTGTRFVAQLHEVFDRLEKLAVELEDIRAGRRGVIKISAPMSPLAGKLPHKIVEFQRLYPDIKVHIEEETSGAAVHGVNVGDLDVALVPETAEATHVSLIPYIEEELVVILPTSHPLTERQALRLSDLVSEQFVGIQRDSGLSTLYRQQMRALGFKLKERAHTTSFQSVRKMVAAGLGIAIVPRFALLSNAESARLAVCKLDEEWAERSLLLCVREPDRRSPATATFMKWLFADQAV